VILVISSDSRLGLSVSIFLFAGLSVTCGTSLWFKKTRLKGF
jgi:hypothetical protein